MSQIIGRDPQPLSEQRKVSWQKWAVSALRWAITIAIIAAAARKVWLEKTKLAAFEISPTPEWLIASGIFYIAGLATCAIFWRSAMRDMGGQPNWPSTLAAYYTGQLAKYVPGKGLVLVVRATMVKGPGVEIAQAGLTVIQETALMMATGAFASTLILLFVDVPHRLYLLAISAVLALGLGGIALPPVVSKFGSLVTKALPKLGSTNMKQCRWKTIAWGAAIITGGWLAMGISLVALVAAIQNHSAPANNLFQINTLATLTAAMALATAGGFVAFTPGGLGIREWILAETLGPVIGSVNAMVAAALLRVVWIIAEAVAAGAFLFMDHQWNRNHSNPS